MDGGDTRAYVEALNDWAGALEAVGEAVALGRDWYLTDELLEVERAAWQRVQRMRRLHRGLVRLTPSGS